jgi:hypothetical protein
MLLKQECPEERVLKSSDDSKWIAERVTHHAAFQFQLALEVWKRCTIPFNLKWRFYGAHARLSLFKHHGCKEVETPVVRRKMI